MGAITREDLNRSKQTIACQIKDELTDSAIRFSLGAFTLPLSRMVSGIISGLGNLPYAKMPKLNPEIWKGLFLRVVVKAPIKEEFHYRFLVQDILMKRILETALTHAFGKKGESLAESKISQAARILLTSAIFAAAHLSNQKIFGKTYAKFQACDAFIGGILLGVLKESSLGLMGSIGLHMANNAVTYVAIKHLNQ